MNSTTDYVFGCVRRPGMPCEFVEDENAEEVCIYCGRVGRRVLFTDQQKVYQPGDEKKLNADKGKHVSIPGTTVSREAYTSNVGSLSAGYTARCITKKGVGKLCHKDVKMLNYRHFVEDYCTKIEIGRKSLDQCMAIFDSIIASSKTAISRKQFLPILLGVLFHGCKRGDLHLTVKDLAKITGKSEDLVRKGIRLVEKKYHVSAYKAKVESSCLIENFCKRLGMEKPFITVFLPNAQTVDSRIRHILEGKKPSTVAATVIHLTLEWFYSDQSKWPLSTISKTVETRLTTLNDSVKFVLCEMDKAGFTPEDVVNEAKGLCIEQH